MAKKELYVAPEDLRTDELIKLGKENWDLPFEKWVGEFIVERSTRILRVSKRAVWGYFDTKGFRLEDFKPEEEA